MIDFDAKVLKSCMNKFARPLVVFPVASQPGTAAIYEARGVWSVRNVDIEMEDSGVLSSDVWTLGVRLSEFPSPPKPGDRVDMPACATLPAIKYLKIDDVDEDGQGGAVWTLKRMALPWPDQLSS